MVEIVEKEFVERVVVSHAFPVEVIRHFLDIPLRQLFLLKCFEFFG